MGHGRLAGACGRAAAGLGVAGRLVHVDRQQQALVFHELWISLPVSTS